MQAKMRAYCHLRVGKTETIASSQVTLDIAQDLYGSSIAFVIHSVDHSLFTRLILWSADAGRDRILLT